MKTLKCSGALVCLFLLLTPFVNAQQLKLGTAPNVIEKSALLELNSSNQGLLLPRISDYTVAPLNAAPDGMIIYNSTDKLLYIRKSGIWKKLIDETNSITSVNGQTGPIVTLTTNNISESVNLYYTDTRARAAFSAGTGINLSGTGVISALNTNALWNAAQLQGRNISTNTPANNDVLTWDNATSLWLPKAVPSASTTTLTGDVTGSGTGSFATTLASVGTAGTYTKVTTDAKGRVISGTTLAATDVPSGSANYIQNISSGTQTASYNITGNGRVGGTFNAVGATTLGSTLGVTGATTLSSTLGVTGAATLSSTLGVTGATTLGNTLIVTGATTLNSTLSVPAMTTGSVLFSGAGGLISQKNASFFWDNTNNRLGLGTNTPNNTLEVAGTTAASGTSGLRLKDLNLATVQTYNSKVLSIDGSGNVIVTNNAAASNWLVTGNTGNAAGSFLGNTDDNAMVIKSNNTSYLEFARRQTLGLVDTYTDYTDPDEKVTYVRSALQFEVPSVVQFYKPKMWTNSYGNFRMKGPAAGTDYFEFGATGTTDNDGGFDFIVGDDGNEPIVFKSYNYSIPATTEIMRLQNGNVGINTAGASPVRTLTVNGNVRFTGSVGISDRLVGRNNTDGDVATIGVGTTLSMSSNVLDANNASAIWNANSLQGISVSSNAPSTGQVLTYNGSAWAAAAASGGSGWSLTGNAGTAPATNFIGTTDAQPLVIRTNNTEVARIASGGNFGIGLAGATPVKRLHVDANSDAIRIVNLAASGTGNPLVINATGDVKQTTALDGVTVGATTKASGAFTTLTVATAPLSLSSGTTNNLVIPTNASFMRITGPTSPFTITGIVAGIDGQIITLYNTVNNNMTLSNATGSTAANQILTMSGGSVNTNGAGTITLIYSATDAKWIVTSINQ